MKSRWHTFLLHTFALFNTVAVDLGKGEAALGHILRVIIASTQGPKPVDKETEILAKRTSYLKSVICM